MGIASLVYRNYVRSGRVGRGLWFLPRKALIKLFGDPVCTMMVHHRPLQMRLSHSLPIYLNDHRFYDRLPQRISQFILRKEGQVTLIDVGANIGDTIAGFYTSPKDRFLAIEPDPNYRKFLVANWANNPNVTIISDLCSSESLQGTYRIEEKNGTAALVPSSDGFAMRSRTLDDILDEHAFAQQANILKVDTDGHDFKVLAGAKRWIAEKQPAVLFECAPFGNPNYIQSVCDTLTAFHQARYTHCILYSNLGELFGKFSLSDLSPIENLLYYQLLSDSLYYDVLLLKDPQLDEFLASELEFFSQHKATSG
jgi:FkbM family methyltransferase